MDHLWSPWRYQYISKPSVSIECIFCELAKLPADISRFILFRGQFNYVVLNIYPYTSGHLLVIPYTHLALLKDLDTESSNEMMDLTKQCQAALEAEYRSNGFNLGMNLGQAAGAGVAAHLHMHILPRWFGDINFTTAIGETRILPETLETTYQRLSPYFQKNAE